jgi:CHAD domain-containing protein
VKSPGNEAIGSFARQQAANRLGNLVFAVRAAAEKPDAEAIHDLRVAIRRLLQSLTVFASLYEDKQLKRIRRRLKRVLDAAGAVRDRDIALEFLDEAGLKRSDRLGKRLVAERAKLERRLADRIVKWSREDFSANWRSELGLTDQ